VGQPNVLEFEILKALLLYVRVLHKFSVLQRRRVVEMLYEIARAAKALEIVTFIKLKKVIEHTRAGGLVFMGKPGLLRMSCEQI
jgi:hypothetical protein